jgi:hypothetical protein
MDSLMKPCFELCKPSLHELLLLLFVSVAEPDPDPGSGAFLALGSGIGFFQILDLESRIPNLYF